MILSYGDKRTQEFAEGEFVPAFQSFEQQAAKRLSMLNAAPSLNALRRFPGNRLEAMKGDRDGQFSIRINRRWRVCFAWPRGEVGPSEVEIVDYHQGASQEIEEVFKRAVHPGEILQDELEEIGVTPTALARDIGVPPNRISQIISGKRAVTGDTALRLGHWFGVEPQFWMNLQTQYDLATADALAGSRIRELPTSEYRPESSTGNG